jgi:hypothetical protein
VGPEHVNVTVLWRPVQPRLNELVGGITPYNYLPGPANFVGSYWRGIAATAPIMAQEVGHLFGLEPPGSPHFEDTTDRRVACIIRKRFFPIIYLLFLL